jgi:hypothetical protein
MKSFMKSMALSLFSLAALAALVPTTAQAQVVYVQPSVVYSAPPSFPVVQSYYAPPVYVAPSVSYYAAPPVTYASPPVTYSYYPQTTVYAAPAAVAVPAGSITTRTYQGFGIFRPRGTYTQSYYSPYVYVR